MRYSSPSVKLLIVTVRVRPVRVLEVRIVELTSVPSDLVAVMVEVPISANNASELGITSEKFMG